MRDTARGIVIAVTGLALGVAAGAVPLFAVEELPEQASETAVAVVIGDDADIEVGDITNSPVGPAGNIVETGDVDNSVDNSVDESVDNSVTVTNEECAIDATDCWFGDDSASSTTGDDSSSSTSGAESTSTTGSDQATATNGDDSATGGAATATNGSDTATATADNGGEAVSGSTSSNGDQSSVVDAVTGDSSAATGDSSASNGDQTINITIDVPITSASGATGGASSATGGSASSVSSSNQTQGQTQTQTQVQEQASTSFAEAVSRVRTTQLNRQITLTTTEVYDVITYNNEQQIVVDNTLVSMQDVMQELDDGDSVIVRWPDGTVVVIVAQDDGEITVVEPDGEHAYPVTMTNGYCVYWPEGQDPPDQVPYTP